MSYALFSGTFNWGLRMAVYRAFTGGWSSTFYGPNIEFWRKILPTMTASALTCWMSVPFEIAKKSFEADKKFPKELQKGYRGPMHAMMNIIKTEGVSYLFRNGMPTYLRNFIQTVVVFSFFDFFLDFLHLLHNDYEIPRLPVKLFCASVAVGVGTMAAYPYGATARNMIEMSPKSIGEGIYNGDYKKAILRLNLWRRPAINLSGYGTFLFSNGPALMVYLLVAESFGMFKTWKIDYGKFPGINISSDFLN